ncbi:hypothetical protein CERZMDRAFT_97265 [Cercospora zeae-maydis SCOH1-5]|uniref:Uncharacterized protein n=1 Tax=Cercospora zeae-maydis SCOH1-5 TaxID=717836 RepID=A0A6A6FH37_9PEZI|nr:hypothetical protein CERZMDRAFT_97265 [Cercospora zeae-maydis SCOH1-5]
MDKTQMRLDRVLLLHRDTLMDATHDAATQHQENGQPVTQEPSTPRPIFSREYLLDMMNAPELELTDLELEEALQSYAATTRSCVASKRASTSMYNEPGFLNGRTLDEIFTGGLDLISGSTLYELSKSYKISTIESKINLGRREGDTISTPKLHKELAKHKKRVVADGSKCLYAYEYELKKARKYHGQPGVHMPALNLRCGKCAICVQEEDRAEPEKAFEYWAGPKRSLKPRPKYEKPEDSLGDPGYQGNAARVEAMQQESISTPGKKVRKLPWLTNASRSSSQEVNAAAKTTPVKRKLPTEQTPKRFPKTEAGPNPYSEDPTPASNVPPQTPIVIRDSEDEEELQALDRTPVGHRRQMIVQLRQALQPKSSNERILLEQARQGNHAKETKETRITDFFQRNSTDNEG